MDYSTDYVTFRSAVINAIKDQFGLSFSSTMVDDVLIEYDMANAENPITGARRFSQFSDLLAIELSSKQAQSLTNIREFSDAVALIVKRHRSLKGDPPIERSEPQVMKSRLFSPGNVYAKTNH